MCEIVNVVCPFAGFDVSKDYLPKNQDEFLAYKNEFLALEKKQRDGSLGSRARAVTDHPPSTRFLLLPLSRVARG